MKKLLFLGILSFTCNPDLLAVAEPLSPNADQAPEQLQMHVIANQMIKLLGQNEDESQQALKLPAWNLQ